MSENIIIGVVSGIGGSIITGILSPLILNTSHRRLQRAEVIKRISEVESCRWSDTNYTEFRKKCAELRATVLMSGGDLFLVSAYISHANIARNFSCSGETPEDLLEEGVISGMIPSDVSDFVVNTATELISSLWSPYKYNFTRRRVKAKLLDLENDLQKEYPNKTFNFRKSII